MSTEATTEQQAPVETTEQQGTTPAQPEVPSIQYEPTGDAGLDYALGFLAKAGIDAEDPALIAASNGDFGLLEAILAQKGIPGWEQAINLGKQAQQRMASQRDELAQAVTDSVLGVAEAFGADWEEVAQWGRENATPEEAEAINAMFAAGPFQAKVAAHYLISNYQKSPEIDVPPRKLAIKEDAVSTPVNNSNNTPLNRKEFAQETAKLYKKYGDAYTGSQEYKALAARLQR